MVIPKGIEPILGDDGSGNDVEIPSFLLEVIILRIIMIELLLLPLCVM